MITNDLKMRRLGGNELCTFIPYYYTVTFEVNKSHVAVTRKHT
jgi:hypothetical protein